LYVHRERSTNLVLVQAFVMKGNDKLRICTLSDDLHMSSFSPEAQARIERRSIQTDECLNDVLTPNVELRGWLEVGESPL